MRLSKASDLIEGQPMFKILEKAHEIELSGKNLIHLEIGDLFFDPPKGVIDAVKISLDRHETHYTDSSGLLELKKEIIRSINDEYGILVGIDDVLVSPANSIIFSALRCLCDEGDRVVLQDPCFPTYRSVAKFLELQVDSFPNDESVVEIINSPNNPTGEMVSCEEVKKSLNSGRFVILDDVYSKIVYVDRDQKDLKLWEHDNFLILKSFSKEFSMSGFRLGYAVSNTRLIKKMATLYQMIYSCTPVFIQRAGIEALRSDISERVEYLKRNRDLMVEGLSKIRGLRMNNPKGAFYVFPDVSGLGVDGKKFSDLCLEGGVVMIDGLFFGNSGYGHVRMSYARPIEEIKEAICRIKAIFS